MRIPASLKKFHIRQAPEIRFHGLESAGNISQQQKNREDDRAEHEHGLDDISPNDCLDAADGGVDRRDHGHENNSPDVSVQIHRQRGKEITPDHDHDGAAEIESHADAKDAREQENSARHVFRFRAEAHGQEFIDALNAVIVVRLDESERDDHACENCSDRELAVKIPASLESFRRSSEKSGCARLRGDDRRQHGPPRDRPRTERKIFEVSISSSGPKPDRDDADEVGEKDDCVDCQPGAHVDLMMNAGWRMSNNESSRARLRFGDHAEFRAGVSLEQSGRSVRGCDWRSCGDC